MMVNKTAKGNDVAPVNTASPYKRWIRKNNPATKKALPDENPTQHNQSASKPMPRPINTMEMSFIRLISIVLMGLGMGLLADWLCCVGFSSGSAFFVAGLFFLIQRLYGDAVLTGATSLPFAVLFTIISYRYAEKKSWLLAVIFILCALLTYPAMAFFFGTLLLLKTLFSPLTAWRKTRKTLAQETALFVAACVIYFLWAHFSSNPHRLPEQYRLQPNLSLAEIASRLLPLINVFESGPWKLPLTQPLWQGWITLSLLVSGLLIVLASFMKSDFYINNKRMAVSYLGQIIFITTVIFFMCSGFYLIIPGREDMGSRMLFATVASCFPIILWCIYQISLLFPMHLRPSAALASVGLLFCITAYKANIVTTINALNYAQYISLVKNQITSYLATGAPLQRIHYIVPEPGYPYNKLLLTNAVFARLPNLPSYKLTWCSPQRSTANAENEYQREVIKCIATLPVASIAVTFSRPDEPFTRTPHMLVMQDKSSFAWELFRY